MIQLLVRDWQQMFIVPKPRIWQTVRRRNAIEDACVKHPCSSKLSPRRGRRRLVVPLARVPEWVITNAASTPGCWRQKRSVCRRGSCLQPIPEKTWVGRSMGTTSNSAVFVSEAFVGGWEHSAGSQRRTLGSLFELLYCTPSRSMS